jgi:hypothetical protein
LKPPSKQTNEITNSPEIKPTDKNLFNQSDIDKNEKIKSLFGNNVD